MNNQLDSERAGQTEHVDETTVKAKRSIKIKMYDSNEPSAPNLADREQNRSDKQPASCNDEAPRPHGDAPSQATTTMRPNSRSNSSVRSDDSLSFGEEMGSDSSDGMVTEMETSPGESGTFVKLQLNYPKSQKERQKSVSRESLTDDSREFGN